MIRRLSLNIRTLCNFFCSFQKIFRDKLSNKLKNERFRRGKRSEKLTAFLNVQGNKGTEYVPPAFKKTTRITEEEYSSKVKIQYI